MKGWEVVVAPGVRMLVCCDLVAIVGQAITFSVGLRLGSVSNVVIVCSKGSSLCHLTAGLRRACREPTLFSLSVCVDLRCFQLVLRF